MEEGSSGRLSRPQLGKSLFLPLFWVVLALAGAGVYSLEDGSIPGPRDESAPVLVSPLDAQSSPWPLQFFPVPILLTAVVLLICSAFFSASEVAFFSLHRVELGQMRSSPRALRRLAARLMDHPGNLLTSILMGNSVANILLGVTLATPTKAFFDSLAVGPLSSYILSVICCTTIIVFFGEILPKVVVVREAERFALLSAPVIFLVNKLLLPFRQAMIGMVGVAFRVTRFSELKPAPFMTDEEFVGLLSDSEELGVIEKDEREMIEGILEFSDATIDTILVPRPDVIALPVAATVEEALALIRAEQVARIPVYEEDLDHIVGILYAKDLLPKLARGEFDDPIRPLMRRAHFVPVTTTVAGFVKMAQQLRTHLVVVVDEYGGTEGIVTLKDALSEVVGELGSEDEVAEESCVLVSEGIYDMEGSFPLDELQELTGIVLEDSEHTTVAGFLMAQSHRILAQGDRYEYAGLQFEVLEVDGKRVAKLRVVVPGGPVQQTGVEP